MRKTSLLLACAWVSATLCGCVSTKLNYVAVPDLPHEGYRHVMVVAAYADLEYQQEVETAALKILRSRGISATSGAQFRLRTEGQDADAQRAALRSEGIDSVLLFEPSGGGSASIWIPMPTTTTATTTTAGNTTTTTVQTSEGGIPSTRTWSGAQVSLLAIESGRRMWQAVLKGDDQGWGYEPAVVLRKMAEKGATALVEQRVLQPAR